MNHPRSGVRTLALAGALAVTLTACGGSDDHAPDTLTAAEFRARANAICVAADEDVEAIARDVAENVTDGVGVAMIRAMMDRMVEMVDELAALEPPASLRGTFVRMLEESRAGVAMVDDAEYPEFETMENPFAAAGTRADELGLDDCVEFLA